MPAPGGLISTSHKASVWIVAPHRVGLLLQKKKYPEQAARGVVSHLREAAELSGFM